MNIMNRFCVRQGANKMRRFHLEKNGLILKLLILGVFVLFVNVTSAETMLVQQGLIPSDVEQGQTGKAFAIIQTTEDITLQASSEFEDRVWSLLDKTDNKMLEYANLDKSSKIISFKVPKGHMVEIAVFGTVGPVTNVLTVYPYAMVKWEGKTNSDIKIIQDPVNSQSKDLPVNLEDEAQLLWIRYDQIKGDIPLRQQGEIEQTFNEIRTDLAKNDAKTAELKLSGVTKLIEYFEDLKTKKDRGNLMLGTSVFVLGVTGMVIWKRQIGKKRW